MKITSDGDPFPAKAGIGNPTNTGPRNFSPLSPTGFDQILDQVPNKEYNIKYRAGDRPLFEEPAEQIEPDTIIGVATNGVPIYSPGSKFNPATNENSGLLTWDVGGVYAGTLLDSCGGRPEETNEYRYRHGNFVYKGFSGVTNNNDLFINSSEYYLNNPFGSDHLRHGANADYPTFEAGHSKIIGWSLDGYPIYGPFGYSNPDDETSDITLMRSRYRLKDVDQGDVIPSGRKLGAPMGTYTDDYTFDSSLPGTLDAFNGRYCKTPDFRAGTYAYFVTFSDSDDNGSPPNEPTNPAYPYVIGNFSRQPRTYT